MIFLNQIVISKMIQYDNSLLKSKSFAASLGVHASVFFAVAYFMTSHPVILDKPEERIVISLSDVNEKAEDIDKLESSHSKILPPKIQQQPIQPTPKIFTKTLEGTPPSTSSVSPEASAPLASTPVPTSSLPSKSIDSPQSASLAPVNELPRNPVSDQQIGGAALGHIRAIIEKAVVYPSIARKLRLEGVVTVFFILNSNGTVHKAKISSTSGSKLLDEKALNTILSLSGDYPVLGKTVELNIPIAFNLSYPKL
ncbi:MULTISPECIES: energy transducer TonB [unclassified Sulfuricurvum]|uniref:energy transducer TonB n=1 Tax=unclassified Sulfuricurvum TaxID=2632390 RepID=UPI000A624178|nr:MULTISPECIES: energy transducer TonB [unclassified Sulfuricurvum]